MAQETEQDSKHRPAREWQAGQDSPGMTAGREPQAQDSWTVPSGQSRSIIEDRRDRARQQPRQESKGMADKDIHHIQFAKNMYCILYSGRKNIEDSQHFIYTQAKDSTRMTHIPAKNIKMFLKGVVSRDEYFFEGL